MVSIVIIGAAMVAWAVAAWRDPSWRPRSVFLPALIASVLAMAVSTVFSRSPRVSLEYLVFAVLLAALYLLLVRLMAHPRLRERILVVAAGSGALIAVAFIGAVVLRWIQLWSLVGRPMVPPLRPGSEALVFTTPNLVAPIIVLLGAVLVGVTARLVSRARLMTTAGVLLVLVAVLMTGSRGGWLGLLVGALSLGVATIYAKGFGTTRTPVWSGLRRISPIWLGLAATAVVVCVLVAPAVVIRLGDTSGNRLTFWRIALQLFEESPLAGAGPGMWGAERIAYTLPSEGDEYVALAHNIYLQTLGEIGLAGAAAGILVVLTLLWLEHGALRDSDPSRRRWALIAAFSTGYLAGHQVVDSFVNIPAVLLAYAIPLALLDASWEPHASFAGSWVTSLNSKGSRLLSGLAVSAALAVALWVELIALRHADAVAFANQGRWGEARALAAAATQADPSMPIYRLTSGLAAAHVLDYKAAADDLQAVAVAGDLPQAWLDLADAYAQLGDPRASDALRNALRLGIQQPAVAVPAVSLALDLGEEQLAVDALAGALTDNPSLAGDAWWQADPSRRATFIEAYDRVVSGNDPRAWQVSLYAGDLDQAASIASGLPSAEERGASLVIEAWGGSAVAYQALIGRCDLDPLDPILGWCIFVSAHRSDAETLGRFKSIGALASISGGPADELRIADGGAVDPTAGNPALLYGSHTYRRFTPWDLLSPTLVHLARQ